ncbi:MAG TPA: acetate--CoA ligase family protein [Nocardioidaceae bacterium]|nr:acetate--CoA ligase family protein [Nocardioidaceae bacterium]
MFEAKSVAVVGASDNPIKLSGRPIAYLKRFGYAGDIYPVNARRATVQGLPAYPDLAAIGVTPDLVMLMLDAASSPQAVRECGRLGVPVVIVSAAGFAEMGQEGAALQQELQAAIAGSDVRVLGPNCLGLIGTRGRLTATFTSALDEGESIAPGGTALISQSGAFGTFIFSAARQAGVDFSHYANTGNEVDLDVVEILSALSEEPEVTTLAAYFEGLSDGQRLAALGRKALAADKPLIVAKAGRSDAGARAVSSHTASLVGSDAVFRDVCDQVGAIAVESINDIVDMMVVFDQRRRLRGRRLSILTMSGGAAALMTDVASANGIEVAAWEPEWQERMRATLPAFGSAGNPIDLTAELIKDPEILRGALEVAVEHPGTDVVAVLVGNAAHGADRLVQIIAEANRATDKPVVVVWTGNNRVPLDALAAHQVARFDDPARAARAIGALASYCERRASAVPAPLPAVGTGGVGADPVARARARGAATLDELDSGQLLRDRGVPVVEGEQVRDAAAAWAAAQRLGLPCAMKLLSDQVAHKSDVGGVRLGLADRESLDAAFADLDELGRSLGATGAGVLVQPMLTGDGHDLELIVGAHRDLSFGPVVTVGLGGVLVDVLRDSVSLVPPFGDAEVRRALGRLRAAPLLGEFRGRPARDVDALVDLLVAFGAAALDLADDVEEMELNPVMVRAAGAGAVGLDALVRLRAEGAGRS